MASARGGSYDLTGAVQRLILHCVCGAFVALYALGMSWPAYAGGGELLPRGQPMPQGIRYVGSTSTGVNTSASAIWSNAGVTTHHRFPVHVSAATLGKLANGAIKRGLPLAGWALAFRDIINGAGWLIDELQGQVMASAGTDQDGLPPGGVAFCIQQMSPTQYRCANAGGMLEAVAHLANTSASGPCAKNSQVGQGRWMYTCWSGGQFNYNVVEQLVTMPVDTWTGFINDNPPAVPPTPAADDALGQLIKNSPQVVNAILVDPVTGAPIRTQELTDALNDLRRSLESANGLAAGTDIVAQEDLAESTPHQTDWPDFCGWANRLCSWLFDEEPEPSHPDLPYVEVDPTEFDDYDIGLGNGTCPAPYVVSVLDGEFEIQWDGLCGFVEYLRPLLIACAWVFAAFMVVTSAGRK